MRVLLVDDEPSFRAYVRATVAEALSDAEIVGEASDGTEAVALAKELRPDVVFIDFGMPRMDGVTATLHIKSALPDIQVVMLSGTDRSDEAADIAEVKLVRKDAVNANTIRAALGQ
ncbi:MAG TPA: response regulator [Gaiellaceae bacterium]|nr:response regulator [Gaiellaceae bacterium]